MQNPDIFFGDFDLNYFDSKSSGSLTQLLETFNLHQIVSSLTFLSSGNVIDHTCINTARLLPYKVMTATKSVHFSDHDALKVCLQVAI